MPTMTPEQYLQDRIDDQIRWYGDRSRSNQTTYRRLRTIEIVLAASIPLLAGYVGEVPSLRVAVGAAGVLLAVIAGFATLLMGGHGLLETALLLVLLSVVAILVTVSACIWASRRLGGGLTGDVYGAVNELVEVGVLALAPFLLELTRHAGLHY